MVSQHVAGDGLAVVAGAASAAGTSPMSWQAMVAVLAAAAGARVASATPRRHTRRSRAGGRVAMSSARTMGASVRSAWACPQDPAYASARPYPAIICSVGAAVCGAHVDPGAPYRQREW